MIVSPQPILLRQRLDRWRHSKVDRAWIKVYSTQIYVRQGPIIFKGQRFDEAVTLANALTGGERTGRLRPFFEWLVDRVDIEAAKVENVFSKRLQSILVQNDWEQVDSPYGDPPSFYRVFKR